ncbi:hypothetical protein BT69DRAFT_1337821 [Atractiella rhizophila]|nr:hypothetical protein BT69DRAFT_1337821 [Atractiella rhizophila]
MSSTMEETIVLNPTPLAGGNASPPPMVHLSLTLDVLDSMALAMKNGEIMEDGTMRGMGVDLGENNLYIPTSTTAGPHALLSNGAQQHHLVFYRPADSETETLSGEAYREGKALESFQVKRDFNTEHYERTAAQTRAANEKLKEEKESHRIQVLDRPLTHLESRRGAKSVFQSKGMKMVAKTAAHQSKIIHSHEGGAKPRSSLPSVFDNPSRSLKDQHQHQLASHALSRPRSGSTASNASGSGRSTPSHSHAGPDAVSKSNTPTLNSKAPLPSTQNPPPRRPQSNTPPVNKQPSLPASNTTIHRPPSANPNSEAPPHPLSSTSEPPHTTMQTAIPVQKDVSKMKNTSTSTATPSASSKQAGGSNVQAGSAPAGRNYILPKGATKKGVGKAKGGGGKEKEEKEEKEKEKEKKEKTVAEKKEKQEKEKPATVAERKEKAVVEKREKEKKEEELRRRKFELEEKQRVMSEAEIKLEENDRKMRERRKEKEREKVEREQEKKEKKGKESREDQKEKGAENKQLPLPSTSDLSKLPGAKPRASNRNPTAKPMQQASSGSPATASIASVPMTNAASSSNPSTSASSLSSFPSGKSTKDKKRSRDSEVTTPMEKAEKGKKKQKISHGESEESADLQKEKVQLKKVQEKGKKRAAPDWSGDEGEGQQLTSKKQRRFVQPSDGEEVPKRSKIGKSRASSSSTPILKSVEDGAARPPPTRRKPGSGSHDPDSYVINSENDYKRFKAKYDTEYARYDKDWKLIFNWAVEMKKELESMDAECEERKARGEDAMALETDEKNTELSESLPAKFIPKEGWRDTSVFKRHDGDNLAAVAETLWNNVEFRKLMALRTALYKYAEEKREAKKRRAIEVINKAEREKDKGRKGKE